MLCLRGFWWTCLLTATELKNRVVFYYFKAIYISILLIKKKDKKEEGSWVSFVNNSSDAISY